MENMSSMFEDSDFNGYIGKWNISKVKDMSCMFKDSHFPTVFIQRFCSKVQLSQDICHICEYVAFKATKYDTPPSVPAHVAAGSIFLVISLCKLDISKKSVSRACKISEVTISKFFKKLSQYSKNLIPDGAVKKYKIEFD